MRTVIALLIALFGFGVAVAWGAEPVARPHVAASQADSPQRAAPRPKSPPRTSRSTLATPDFDKRAREAPSVICACLRGGSRA